MVNPAANLASAEGSQEIPLGFLANKQVNTKTFSIRLQRGGEAKVKLLLQMVDNYVEYYMSIKQDHEDNAFIYKDNVDSFTEMLEKLYRLFPDLKNERAAIPGKQFVAYKDNNSYIHKDTYNMPERSPQQFMNMNDDLSQSNASSEFKPPQANVKPIVVDRPALQEGPSKPQANIPELRHQEFSSQPRSLTPGGSGKFNPYNDSYAKQGQLQLSGQKQHPGIENTSYIGYDSGSYRPTTQPALKENRSLGYSAGVFTGAPTELVAYTSQKSYRGSAA